MLRRLLNRAKPLGTLRALALAISWLRRAATSDPRLRERATAISAFAAIALFAGLSLDYLLTGGPRWSSAQAAPLAPAADYVRLEPLPEFAYLAPALAPKPAPALEFTPITYPLAAGEALLGGPGDSPPPSPKPANPRKLKA
jgi:hypothetical protein